MKRPNHFPLPVFLLLFLAFISICASAQTASNQTEERRERNIDDIRTEAIHRAEVGQYPLIGLDPGDVKEAFNSIHTRDKDEWAAAFMGVADRYMNEANSLEKSDPAKATPITSAPGAFTPSDGGRFPLLPASSARTKKRSKLSGLTQNSGILPWRLSEFPSKEKRSSATCASRKMPAVPCRSCWP